MNEWFQQLSGTVRVNVICDLLSCCSPVELCFFSTYLRDLCNFEEKLQPIREQANVFHVDKKLLSIFNSENVNELITITALIDLMNTDSASAVYDIVHRDLNSFSFAYDSLLNNDAACEGVLQLLTLISNHPAFNFLQKSNLFEHIVLLSKKCSMKSAEIILNGFSNMLSVAKSDPTQLKTDEEKVSDLTKPVTSLSPNGDSLCLSGVSVSEGSIPKSILQGKIKGIELRSSRKKKTFILETTWASSKRTEVFKSFKDVVDFHEKLLELFPDNYICDSPAAKIQNGLSSNNNAKDYQTMIVAQYFSNFLHQVPLQIKDSDVVLNFFKPPSNSRPPPTLIGSSNLNLSIPRNEDSKPESITKDCNTSVPKNSTNCTKPTKVHNNCQVKSTKQKINVPNNKALLRLPEHHEQNGSTNCASSVLPSSRLQQNYQCTRTEILATNNRNCRPRDVSLAVSYDSQRCNNQHDTTQVLIKTNSADKLEHNLKNGSSKFHGRTDTRKSRSLEILDDKSDAAYAYGPGTSYPGTSVIRKEVIQKQERANRDRIFVKSTEYVMQTQGIGCHNNFREYQNERLLDESSPPVATPNHPGNTRRQRSYRNTSRWPQFMTANDFYYAAYNQLPPFSSKKPASGFKYS